MSYPEYRIGLDIGSTTVKAVVLDQSGKLLFHSYQRHFSQITQKAAALLEEIDDTLLKGSPAGLSVSGSAGMGLSVGCGIPFVQEVYATRLAALEYAPETDVAIELGGEDAKILFLKNGMEVRMNGSCAGGTGAFIDQMAALLKVSADELGELAQKAQRRYTIASRCGVFAKSDIQPLINQGAHKEDIAESILYAVVNQTIAGLAQGRKIEGNVLYLGGPLTFLPQLRNCFDKTLGLNGKSPENSLYFVALGAAHSSAKAEPMNIGETAQKLAAYIKEEGYASLPPLFASKSEYDEFAARHDKNHVPRCEYNPADKYFLGVDAGSTTVKLAVSDEQGRLLFSLYRQNSGNPVPIVREFLTELYTAYPNIKIGGAAATGYGEAIIRHAFGFDYGLVETIAHFTAAKKFMPQVEFVIDIGGQDIKCFKIKSGIIDNIFLNEACSSGCGSFLQTFAQALGYPIEDFAKMGLFAQNPVELGSRCTVFMNSSVKQAQKDGANVESISAGLSISVVKNALYKVIRVSSKEELGRHIVVQGGTFLNDAVLRGFENELSCEVVRPDISGLMGCYGASLHAASKAKAERLEKSMISDLEMLENFSVTENTTRCGLCSNNCRLTVSIFQNGNRFVGGNKCDRPVKREALDDSLNLYEYKRALLSNLFYSGGSPDISDTADTKVKSRGTIGIPLGLAMVEQFPFWHGFFKAIGFKVITDGFSDRHTYTLGQASIPSDTVCFPAKLVHGHMERILDKKPDAVFFPSMTYNFNEKKGDNHFHCPVVAYYPEVVRSNMDTRGIPFICEHIKPENHRRFYKKLHEVLVQYFPDITYKETAFGIKAAYTSLELHNKKVREQSKRIIDTARSSGKPIIVLAGRPYHIDPEVSHSIDKLISSLGAAVISEDAVAYQVNRVPVNVLNQWTYHARMYEAAKYISDKPDMQLIQLVSFGCGIDAITADEVRELLEKSGKIYTQIKIDEITNLGTVKIRLRSLFAALALR